MAESYYERLKKALNPFGRTAEAIEKETAPKKKEGPKTFTTPAVQDRMKAELEAAREKERQKMKVKK